jgi:hypothetical protein
MGRTRSIPLLAALLTGFATASAQPVTDATTCREAFTTVNAEFLGNIMMMRIRASMRGAIGSSVRGYADWLNRFVSINRTGDAGVHAAEGLDRAWSTIGRADTTSEAERLDVSQIASDGCQPAAGTR